VVRRSAGWRSGVAAVQPTVAVAPSRWRTCGRLPHAALPLAGSDGQPAGNPSDRRTHETMRFRSLAAVKWPTALCCTLVGL
jgi:hypothetical protein